MIDKLLKWKSAFLILSTRKKKQHVLGFGLFEQQTNFMTSSLIMFFVINYLSRK